MDKILRNAQTLLKNKARFVLGKRGRRTSTLTLMEECSWLSIQDMIKHNSLLMLWKSIQMEALCLIASKIQIDDSGYLHTQRPRILHTTSGFRLRSISYWN